VLLLLTAVVGSSETSLIGNMRVTSQRITMYRVIVTFLLSQRKNQRDAAELMFIDVHFLNMFQTLLCPSSGVQD
jgi:hypothetical protein